MILNSHFSFYRTITVLCKSTTLSIFQVPGRKIIWYRCCFILLFSFILILTSCNSITTTSENRQDSIPVITFPETSSISKEETAALKYECEQWYDSALKQTGFNGGILVAKNGNIIFEQYHGTGHLPGSDTIGANSPLHIASTSKTFTAMAVLKLWQDGKLNIDDDYNKYFPQFNYPGITIRSLLSQRSGLPNYTYFMESLGWDKTKFVTNEDILNFLITRKSELTDITSPNTHFTYCNTNYALLALLIEKASRKKYAEYLDQTFFIPLQMKNSYVFKLADTLKAIPSYDWRGRLQPLNFLDLVYGDKNIYTTPRDLLIWDRALTGNLLFTPETLKQAYAPYSNEKPGIRNYGLGWRMYNYPTGKKIIYHNGWWHGSNASFIRQLYDSATIIVIGNKFNRSVYHAKDLMSVFGDYYNPGDEEETDNVKLPDSDTVLKTVGSGLHRSKKKSGINPSSSREKH